MPVFKFRSVEEMSQPVWRAPGDPELYEAIAGLWAFGARIQGRRFPPGVHRHRSIEDLNATVGRWEQAHVDALVRTLGGASASRRAPSAAP